MDNILLQALSDFPNGFSGEKNTCELFSFYSVIFYEGNNIFFAFETNFNACFKFARRAFNIDYLIVFSIHWHYFAYP